MSHIISNDLVMFAAIKAHPYTERTELAQFAHELAGRTPESFQYEKTTWLALLDRLVMLGYVYKEGYFYCGTSIGAGFLTRQAKENFDQASRIYNAIAFGII
jgi:hypothetical protein